MSENIKQRGLRKKIRATYEKAALITGRRATIHSIEPLETGM
jgi:hypothetical protein